ncbi:MAG TPA: aldehyde ferredoxin oxidoreductase [Candidatus Atribacteria bacterium]|nr:aldehyde ferredoxin oxidoreductase [Candidatus Atribacteria bacterium]
MGNGYWERVLRINLSDRTIKEESISEVVWKKILGGAGYGAKVLHEEVTEKIGALDPENRIIFASGPFQATQQSGAAKFCIISRSPLTGIFGETTAGAGWGIELKKAGYDAIIIQGKSDTPVYLQIYDRKAEIKDAREFWGRDAYTASDHILKEIGDQKSSIACIGQAGEKQVAIACVVVDKHSFGGRCGLGAVMGSKNLKAIVVRGTQSIPIHNLEKLLELNREIGRKIFEATKDWLRMHGTPFVEVGCEELGDTPVKYWSGDVWSEGANKLGSPNYTDVLNAKPWPCKFCVVGCHRHIKVKEPIEYAMEGAGPEYETLGMLGNCCLMDDLKALAKMNDWCNRYGIDTISAGAFIGFMMDCFEKGILKEKDFDGKPFHWGDKDMMFQLIHRIGNREGIGELFSRGIVHAAKSLGKEATELAVHVKGLDLPAHDPRAFFSLAINYATGSAGGHHERGNPQVASSGFLLPEAGITEVVDRFRMENSEFVAAKYQDYGALSNSLCHCKFMLFGGMTLTDLLETLNAVTGWDWTMEEFLKTGERIFTLQRVVNINYGVTRKDDILPKKIFEPAKEGSRSGKIPAQFELVLDRYYKLRGWDENGIPKKGKLKELQL